MKKFTVNTLVSFSYLPKLVNAKTEPNNNKFGNRICISEEDPSAILYLTKFLNSFFLISSIYSLNNVSHP